MPRGNDPDAAAEFEKEYGVQGNAEKLIQAHRRARSRELRAASLGRLDPVATNALDLDKVEKALDGEGTVVSAAVRGGNVVAVVEDETGRTSKQVLPRDKAGLTKESLKRSREALGVPEVPVGENRYRAEEESAAVVRAREEDEEERERLAKREDKRAEAQEQARKDAEKARKKDES